MEPADRITLVLSAVADHRQGRHQDPRRDLYASELWSLIRPQLADLLGGGSVDDLGGDAELLRRAANALDFLLRRDPAFAAELDRLVGLLRGAGYGSDTTDDWVASELDELGPDSGQDSLCPDSGPRNRVLRGWSKRILDAVFLVCLIQSAIRRSL